MRLSVGDVTGRKPNISRAWPFLAFWTMPDENGVTVEGVVMGRDVDEEGLFRSVVEFQTPDAGETVTVEGSISSSSSPTIGDTPTVSFLSGSPSEARVIEDQ